MSENNSVDELVNRLQPVPRLKSIARLKTIYLALSFLVLAFLLILGFRQHDLAFKLHNFSYAAELFLLVLSFALFSRLSFYLAVPGRKLARAQILFPFFLLIAWLGLILGPGSKPGLEVNAHCLHTGMSCALATLAAATVWGLLFYGFLSAGAPLRYRLCASIAGLAAFSLAAFWLRIDCSLSDPIHLLLFHVAPVGLLVALAYFTLGKALRW